MPAGTAYSSIANSDSFFRKAKRITAVHKNPNLRPVGLFAFDSGADTVAATNTETAGDELFTIKFPDETYLLSLQVTASVLDSNGIPALVFDTIVEDSAGSETVLINDSTIGQAGGSDELDANAGHILRDVSNQYLGFKVATGAATAAAGTIRYKGLVWMGPLVNNL